MKLGRILRCISALLMSWSFLLADAPSPKSTSGGVEIKKTEDVSVEGEKRFRANCGRCHQAPHKLSPPMMRTAVRHMRVRANITNEDMRILLEYLTQ